MLRTQYIEREEFITPYPTVFIRSDKYEQLTVRVQFSDSLQAGRSGFQNPSREIYIYIYIYILFRLPTIPDLPWVSVKIITKFFPRRKWPRLLLYMHLHV